MGIRTGTRPDSASPGGCYPGGLTGILEKSYDPPRQEKLSPGVFIFLPLREPGIVKKDIFSYSADDSREHFTGLRWHGCGLLAEVNQFLAIPGRFRYPPFPEITKKTKEGRNVPFTRPMQQGIEIIVRWMLIPLAILVFGGTTGGFPVWAQNVTPRPTILSPANAQRPQTIPTPIRNLRLDLLRFVDMRVESVTPDGVVLSDNLSQVDNRRFYFWDNKKKVLTDTNEDGLSGSVITPEEGGYMLYLHDEFLSRRDVNGDGQAISVVLRMYHFQTGQRFNIGIPARSATPRPDETRHQFEYHLYNHVLSFSASNSPSNNNTQAERNAPWHIVNMLDLVYAIEGTPTPTPSPTYTVTPGPSPTPTPTLTPSLTPTSTPIPTVPPELRNLADMNSDGKVDALDLMLFRYFWFKEE